MREGHLSLLERVLAAPTAPFREQAVARVVRDWAERLGLPVQTDRHGNLLVRARRGRVGRAHRPWVLAAHMDHPGFVADRQRGRVVQATFHGGVAERYFAGAPVVWFTPDGEIRGVVERTAQVGPEGRRRRRAEVRVGPGAAVPPGAAGMWDLPAMRVRGRTLASRACDDLVGLAMAMAAVEDAVREPSPLEAYLLATRAEEVGFIGALGAVRSGLLPPNAAVLSIETSSLAGGPVRQGAGPVLRVGDRAGIFDPGASRTLHALAEDLHGRDESFRFQRALMAGGTCEATAFGAGGIPATGLCLALGNYHNQGRNRIAAETVNLDDFAGGVRLLAAMTRRSADAGGGSLRRRLDERWRAYRDLL